MKELREGDFSNITQPPEVDQLKRDQLYSLEPEGSGQVRISLQWVYSKVKLLQDIHMLISYQIAQEEEEERKYEELLKEA